MKYLLTLAVLFAASAALAQSCGPKGPPPVGCHDPAPSCVCNSEGECGWQWKCSSGEADYVKASDDAMAKSLVGDPIMNIRINRGVKKYCKAHPGEPFHWTGPDGQIVRRGTCPH